MPLYTYRCNDNDHEFQVRQRMMDEPITVCPVCGGPVRRVVSSVGVVFKGSGFYVTDNRSSKANGKVSKPKHSESTDRASELATQLHKSPRPPPVSPPRQLNLKTACRRNNFLAEIAHESLQSIGQLMPLFSAQCP